MGSIYLSRVVFRWIIVWRMKSRYCQRFIALTKNIKSKKFIISSNSISLFVIKVLYQIDQNIFIFYRCDDLNIKASLIVF